MENGLADGASPVRSERVPSFRTRPPVVTLSLIGANLLMAFAQFAAGGFSLRGEEIANAPADWALGAKVPSLVAHGEYWRLVTASFLHGSWWPHLLVNMLGLMALGRFIEMFYGPGRMLAIYVLSAVAGTIASYFGTPWVSLGASTGVLGLMGALMFHNRKYRRHLPERLNSLYWFLIALMLLQFAADIMNDQVDLWGHVGGFAGGAVMGALLASRVAGPGQSERDWLPLPTALATVFGLLAFGVLGLLSTLPREMDLLRGARTRDPELQARHLEQVVRARPYFIEARLELAGLFVNVGRDREAAFHYEAAKRDKPAYVEQRYQYLAQRYMTRADRFYRFNNWERCAESYRAATVYAQEDEVRAQAHNGYAWVLADKLKRDLKEAERSALQAVRLRPDEPKILDTLAWVYYRQRRLDESLRVQRRAVSQAEERRQSLGPDIAELHFHLGAIHEARGEKGPAIESYAKALRSRGYYPEAEGSLRRLSGVPLTPDREKPAPAQDPGVRHGIL